MFDRLAVHRPPKIRNLSTRTRRCTIGTAAVIPALLIGVLGSIHSGPPQDSGLVACAYPLATHDVPAADDQKLRAEFADSRWPDLGNAGTTYVDLAVQLLLRSRPTGIRPSGSISGCPPPAQSTDSERQGVLVERGRSDHGRHS
jgi:hypothetical protein